MLTNRVRMTNYKPISLASLIKLAIKIHDIIQSLDGHLADIIFHT